MTRSLMIALAAIGLLIAPAQADSTTKAPFAPPKAPKTPSAPNAPQTMYYMGGEDGDSVNMVNQLPNVWIGVRCSPVPDSLSAHLGRGGIMIANIVTGGPAEKAGLERYDVLVSLNDKPIEEMQSLVEAIVDVGAGKSAKLKIIRAGKPRTLTITPVDRPEQDTAEFKYDEPQTSDTSDVRYFGHKLQKDAQGRWMLEPLGRMPNLPDHIKDSLNDFSSPAWRKSLDAWKAFQVDPFRLRLQVDPDDPSGGMFFMPGVDDDEDAQVEISINANVNGNAIALRRSTDGKVTVTRTDAQGKQSETTYDSLDELSEKDKEAYRTYRRFSGYRARPMITLPPELKNLGQLQQQYQVEIQQQLEKARERAQQALDEAKRSRTHTHVRQSQRDNDGQTTSESISLTVDNGRIHLVITEGGQTRTYDFRDAAEFRAQEPELYERFKSSITDEE